jgi:hypothetical protein
MPEDGGAGMAPHEHLHKVGEDRHEEDGVGGEVMKLEAELLQEQVEGGGDRRHQPAHGVRVEEDELPRGKITEGDFAGPNLPGVLQCGPSKKAAHQVQLGLALEAARKRERRHGDGRCDCGGWIAREQEGEEMPSARKPIAKGERRRKGTAVSTEGKSKKVAGLFGAYLLSKSCSPSRAPRLSRRSRTAAYTKPPPLTPNGWWARAHQSRVWPLEARGKGGIRTARAAGRARIRQESEPPDAHDAGGGRAPRGSR